MPYRVEQRGEKFAVVNTETDEVKAEHDDRETAERQVRLLHEIEREDDE